ncbi:MAG TPA: hypothetical protein VMU57_10630 [Edaphobacter sp.]|uniref:hypothetical protein n=1 Tax=Edaphobacter sp. TaxID=1934404 RepID=UPI002C3F26A8|nr:hypothetical protein [Edaphobacter sp.]HUZ95358.1 hypothetical protein [Edaphobacter sp.]
MSSGSFYQGLLSMTNWVGNGVMPLLAGLMIAMGIYKFSRGGDFERYLWGAMGALSISGLLRLAEVFARQGSGTAQMFEALLTLTDWVCNVILPVYAGIEVVRAVLGVSGVGIRLNIGDDWMRHAVAAFAALSCSGLLRLLEHFIAAGTGGVA